MIRNNAQASLIVTVFSEAVEQVNGAAILQSLQTELTDVNTVFPNLVISVDSLIRYGNMNAQWYQITLSLSVQDGCAADTTIIPSQSNDSSLELEIHWPETNLGVTIIAECPCSNIQLRSSTLQSTRMCGGNYSVGAQWDAPAISACNFSDTSRQVCQLAEVYTLLCMI